MYLVQLGNQPYSTDSEGEPFTLVTALAFVRGCGGARILRDDAAWTPVVGLAGSDAGPLLYLPTGRKVHRRMSRAGRAKYAAQVAADIKWRADRHYSEVRTLKSEAVR